MRDRHNACRDGRGRSARGAAGRVIEIPGVARRAVKFRLGERHEAVFRHVGLAERNEACRLETRDERRVEAGRSRWREARTAAVRPAFLEAKNVFQKHRYAGESTAKLCLRARPRAVVGFEYDSVEFRIVPFDSLDRGLHELDGLHLFLAYELGKADARSEEHTS